MEKRKAHYALEAVKAIVIRDEMLSFTRIARRGANAMGLDDARALAVVGALSPFMLFKSMTTHADSTVWQDVYHAPCPNGKMAYIKVTLQEGAVVIQFKEV
ncbi:MAG: motility quorum-sensing regulator MqsR [Hydrogenophilales bacterium CG_4_9_14_3_um_filter_59_35]|nr:MAG: motility quorum-sensing regulator MqsR [Hydrogenophilales bacterium CG18_big_fil_WC_8_21_14_2_50_58_12]PIX99715.1 MAG: motility quorum-sensing regulator MqsR [Hydrogenophilales bacterium CG_4_10_14_3_um_filter_58_23]PJB07778.1 MAG: motility quorum-sensing regulator MqsR [Hydrogenophilales bacterium CG_4_9_14_3_um_filter_59_35]